QLPLRLGQLTGEPHHPLVQRGDLLASGGERGLQGVHPLVHLGAVVPAHDHREAGLVLAHRILLVAPSMPGTAWPGAGNGPRRYASRPGSSHFGHNSITSGVASRSILGCRTRALPGGIRPPCPDADCPCCSPSSAWSSSPSR